MNDSDFAVASETAYLEEARRFAVQVASRRLKGAEGAEDLAQDVMLKLWSMDGRPENTEAWITRAITNLAIDDWRAEKRKAEHVEHREIRDREAVEHFLRMQGASASYAAMHSLAVEQIWEELQNTLSERELRVLRLTASGHTNTEIAEELGYAGPDSVKVTVSRIRTKVRKLGDERIAEILVHPRPY